MNETAIIGSISASLIYAIINSDVVGDLTAHFAQRRKKILATGKKMLPTRTYLSREISCDLSQHMHALRYFNKEAAFRRRFAQMANASTMAWRTTSKASVPLFLRQSRALKIVGNSLIGKNR